MWQISDTKLYFFTAVLLNARLPHQVQPHLRITSFANYQAPFKTCWTRNSLVGPSNLRFNKPSRWFSPILKLADHCCIVLTGKKKARCKWMWTYRDSAEKVLVEFLIYCISQSLGIFYLQDLLFPHSLSPSSKKARILADFSLKMKTQKRMGSYHDQSPRSSRLGYTTIRSARPEQSRSQNPWQILGWLFFLS